LALGLAAWRGLLPERGLEQEGARALLDAAFALALLGVALLTALGVGTWCLRRLGRGRRHDAETALFALPLGLGALGYGVLALGIPGLLNFWTLALWLAGAAWWGGAEAAGWLQALWGGLRRLPGAWRGLPGAGRWLAAAALVLAALTVLHALAPPWDVDGLMYHLEGPRRFLAAGKIDLLPDLWQANGANLPDMLYLLGLGFGSDTFARLLHASCAALLAASVFVFGRRWGGAAAGAAGTAILLGTPIFIVWANWAYTDMAWALYVFLSLCALLRGGKRRLALAALLQGLALGSKYLSLGSLVLLALLAAWRLRRLGWRRALGAAGGFVLLAALAGLPFYLKNLALSGNPVYPFYWGGPGWDGERLAALMDFLNSFGVGRSLADYLALPLNLFARQREFAGFMPEVEIPSPLFVLALLYPLGRRTSALNAVALFGAGWFAWWALGSQQTRFLLPAFPAYSLLAGAGLAGLARSQRWRRLGRVALYGLCGGMLAVTLFYAGVHFLSIGPLPPLLGLESKDAFLRRVVYPYPAAAWVRRELPPQARVMQLWDGQGYYCGERCLPDPEQSRWTYLYGQYPQVPDLAQALHQQRVSHLMVSQGDVEFILAHDPSGRQRQAYDFFVRQFQPACARPVYQDAHTTIYRLICPAGPAAQVVVQSPR
jgi:hypothetical protein